MLVLAFSMQPHLMMLFICTKYICIWKHCLFRFFCCPHVTCSSSNAPIMKSNALWCSSHHGNRMMPRQTITFVLVENRHSHKIISVWITGYQKQTASQWEAFKLWWLGFYLQVGKQTILSLYYDKRHWAVSYKKTEHCPLIDKSVMRSIQVARAGSDLLTCTIMKKWQKVTATL